MSFIDLVKTNVFAVTDKSIITVDLAELDRKTAERRAAADVAEKAANPPEADWRGEYEELNRRLAGQLTIEEAKVHASNQESLHNDAIREVESELKYVR